ncbi:MAG: DUF72 domain-containing protein [Planctomycetota bacterium]
MPDKQLAFDWSSEDPKPPSTTPGPQIAPLADRLRRLADRGIYLGTSSWKYPGWVGRVYDAGRYQVRGKFAQRKFEQQCLAEYATIFPTVGGDFSFYQFPSPKTWENLFAQVPAGFRFSLKIPEDVTVDRFPDLPRYGRRAGTDNPHFMDAALVRDKLLEPLAPYRDKLGVLIFEFGAIHRPPMNETAKFASALDRMLSRLPSDAFKFAVEVRNPAFVKVKSEYLTCLESHNVAHCLNSWTRMPPLAEQMRVPGIITADHVAARLLLRPGRAYQQAVDMFAPYERVQDPYPEGRSALRDLIERCLENRQPLFAFVNNRFEGNAIETIDAGTTALPNTPSRRDEGKWPRA